MWEPEETLEIFNAVVQCVGPGTDENMQTNITYLEGVFKLKFGQQLTATVKLHVNGLQFVFSFSSLVASVCGSWSKPV